MKKKEIRKNGGMTYVELIVVLSIFSLLSAVAIFNYGDFQSQVDIRNLASDVALQVVQAQNSSLSGVLPPAGYSPVDGWKPAYGVYFDLSAPKQFIYFVDLNNNNMFDGTDCTGECLSKVSITKNNTISGLSVYYKNSTVPANLTDLTISFSRPNSGAFLRATPPFAYDISYVEVDVQAPNGKAKSAIKFYPSGRVQVN